MVYGEHIHVATVQAKRERARQEDDSSAPAYSKRQRSSTEAVQPEPAQAAPAIAGPLPQPLLPPLPQQEVHQTTLLLSAGAQMLTSSDCRTDCPLLGVLQQRLLCQMNCRPLQGMALSLYPMEQLHVCDASSLKCYLAHIDMQACACRDFSMSYLWGAACHCFACVYSGA